MSPSVFLPYLDTAADDELVRALGRIGPILVPAAIAANAQLLPHTPYIVLADPSHPPHIDQVIQWLDFGATKVVVPLSLAKELIGIISPQKLMILLDISSAGAVSDTVQSGVSGVLLRTSTIDIELVTSLQRFFLGTELFVHATSDHPKLPSIRQLRRSNAVVVIPSSQLTLSSTSSTQLNVGDAFFAPLVSDRPDGLIPTIVAAHNQGGRSLGLVYSSQESIRESIVTGRGVYQSRKRGLWRKGETSGAMQTVVSIHVDCDLDSLEYGVLQEGSGFCHLGTPTCFGPLSGIAALEHTLCSRRESAPPGSYTRRLFDDPTLLRSKILEEADELCQAETKEEISFEAADLFYFALVRCVADGVTILDIERSLDRKARKVTRRPGHAKPEVVSSIMAGVKATKSTPPGLRRASTSALEQKIQMRSFDLTSISPASRANLLRRPVLKSDEMIAKVRPIVDEVRTRGDAALIDFTAKFDKATLSSTVIRPPFSPESMALKPEVKDAIDVAYRNVHKFHAAQADKTLLRVETMPGVVCSRFARPIARVGLYVPGGTAVLPSTALMLGIPAQVAGCKEIVLATPPRADGSISPEVMYVAQLVGASAILKAGGAQAVAAMAYGTDTVPKVDKIFGPGNQWVTAAKMLVQNDTDALVSIDMPAGPSEVLVVADSTANPAFVAADLLSQAEHGPDSQVVLVAINLSDSHLSAIEDQIDEQARALPRVAIVRESVAKSIIVKASSVQEALDFSNDYAPEHLILHLEDAPAAVDLVQNAGSVFVGAFSPESCGDYASGTNHTLPTNGFARQFSGVNTQSFQKHITSQEATQEGLKELGPIVVTLAECEGLQAHANAVSVRLREQ